MEKNVTKSARTWAYEFFVLYLAGDEQYFFGILHLTANRYPIATNKKKNKWIQFSDIHIYLWKNVCVMRRESYWKFRMPHFDRIFDLGMHQMWSSLFWVPVWRLPIDVNFSIKINSIHSRMIIEIIISTSVCAQNHIEMIYNMWVKISYTIINKLLFMKCS